MSKKAVPASDAKKPWRQLILLDADGYILASCDSLFCTQDLRIEPIFRNFPLLESVFNEINCLEINGVPLRFSKVETTFPPLQGFYDFSFERTELDSSKPILWIVYDYTRRYQNHLNFQQKRYELELAKELLKNQRC